MANRKKKNRSAPSTSMQKPPSPAPVVSSPGKQKRKKAKRARGIHPYASLMIDPRTVKLDYVHPPDQNPKPTVVFRVAQNFTMTTDGFGGIWKELRPLTAGFNTTMTCDASGKITAVGTPAVHSDNTALATSFSAVRPLIMCVEIEYCGEAQLAKGTLALCVSDNPAEVNWTFPMMTDEPYYREHSVTHEGKVAAIARYAPSEFYTMASVALGTGHPRIFVMATGMPVDSACIRVRTTIVNEYLCVANSLLQTQARHSPSLPLEFASAQSLNMPEAVIGSGPEAIEKIVRFGFKAYNFVRTLQHATNYSDDLFRLEL